MKRKILDYTTDVPVSKTIFEIQNALAEAGAKSILFDYDQQGQIKAVLFKIRIPIGQELPFKLPAKVEEAYRVLHGGKSGEWRYKEARMENAKIVAWRIVKDWLKAQLAIIRLEMAKPEEVFLPYLIVGENQTLFEKMVQTQFALPSGKKNDEAR